MKLIKLICLVSLAAFTAVGCENKLTKLSEPTEPTEQTEQIQSLKEVLTAGAEAEELGVIIERNVPVPMRDGTILRADVHRPDRGGPYPVLVQRTPYGKNGNFDRFVKAGYIVVSQDARGRYESEGRFESFWRSKTHDAEDGYDTIEWAAKLPGSNGKVGTFGTSYPAFLQWRLAPLRPNALLAMSACSIPGRGGATGEINPGFRLQWCDQMATDMRRQTNLPGVYTIWETNLLWNTAESEKWINWLPWLELPDDFFGYETDAVKSWLKKPHDIFTLDKGCKDISVPNFDIVGWYDHANGDMLLFRTMVKEAKTETARKGSRIIIGPWNHGICSRRYGNIDFGPDAVLDKVGVQIRWFDFWLKDIQNGVDKDAQVKIFVMGDNKWRDEQYWPLHRTEEKTFFIMSKDQANTPSGNGKLVDERPQSIGIDNYVYDPRDPVPTSYGQERPRVADRRPLANRQDILVYQTELLTERIEVTGNPIVELYAASSAPDTAWFVWLIDVAPDGLARDVSSGMLRARYRDGTDKPKLIKPDEVVKYNIRMKPTSNAFLPGHRIRLDITSSDFPSYDRNHNTPFNQNADATLVTASQTIYHGGEQATRIILPWVPNPPGEEKYEPEPEKQMYQFHQAAADGDIERVKQLISEGADVNAKDEGDNTPLCHAVRKGMMEMVQLLVKAGADVNAGSWPPLCEAVDKNDIVIAKYLIGHGANVNSPEDWPPLQEATDIDNNIEMVELLIAKGADINAGRWTALHNAAGEGRKDIVELLIQKGADVNAKDEEGKTPLRYAAQTGKMEVVQLLVEAGADVNAKDSRGITPFNEALFTNKKDVVELLLAKGADFDSKCKYRLTSFFDSKYKYGLTALHKAVVEGYRDIAELLLAKGAKVDEKDYVYEFTALHYAARFGNKNVAELLIANGADINAKDKWDYQPIHWAAYHNRADVVELLISEGADINAKTSLDQTPIQLAQERRSTKAVELLRKHGAKE